jgi:hypothetical protein
MEWDELIARTRHAEKMTKATAEDLLGEMSTILQKIGEIMDAWDASEPEGPLWMKIIEPLTLKILLQSASLQTLMLDGTVMNRLSDKQFKIRDLSSILTIARSQLEAYLTFYYLFVHPKSEEDFQLRNLVYRLHSLTLKQNTPLSELPKDVHEQYEQEALEILSVQNEIEANPVFQDFSKSWRGQLLSGSRAKTMGWDKIVQASPLNDYVMKAYDLYANHAHSEFVSLSQLSLYIKNPVKMELMFTVVARTALFVLSVFIMDLVNITKQEAAYEAFSPEIKESIRLWKHSITFKK